MVSEGPSNGRRATTPPKRGRNALLIGSETPLRTTHTALVQTIAPINLPRGGAGADCDWLALSARETTPRRASNRHLDPPPARVSQVNISKRLPEPPRPLNPPPRRLAEEPKRTGRWYGVARRALPGPRAGPSARRWFGRTCWSILYGDDVKHS